MYYHELTLRASNGTPQPAKIIGSDTNNIDDACRERAEIQKQYHANQIVSIVTLGPIRN